MNGMEVNTTVVDKSVLHNMRVYNKNNDLGTLHFWISIPQKICSADSHFANLFTKFSGDVSILPFTFNEWHIVDVGGLV